MSIDKSNVVPGRTHVQCPICKKWYKLLGSHLKTIHGIDNPTEYAKKHGIQLWSEQSRYRHAEGVKGTAIATTPEWYKTISAYEPSLRRDKVARRAFDKSLKDLKEGKISLDEEIALTRAVIASALQSGGDGQHSVDMLSQIRDSWVQFLTEYDMPNRNDVIDRVNRAESIVEINQIVLSGLSGDNVQFNDDTVSIVDIATMSRLDEWLKILSRLEDTKTRVDERREMSTVRSAAQKIMLSIMDSLDRITRNCPSCGASLNEVRIALASAFQQISLEFGVPFD